MYVPVSNNKSPTNSKYYSFKMFKYPKNEDIPVVIENKVFLNNNYQQGNHKDINKFHVVNKLSKDLNRNKNQLNIKNANTRGSSSFRTLPVMRTIVKIVIYEKTIGLFNNKSSPITISELGIEGDTKASKTNCIFFGTDESNSADHSYDIVMSIGADDFLPSELFYIFYEPNIKTFMLKSLTKKYPFSLMIAPHQHIFLEYHQKNYFKLGKVNISIYLKSKEEQFCIVIKKGESIPKKQTYSFTKANCPITIGKCNSTINLMCDSISRWHALINYDNEKDLFYYADKDSGRCSQYLLKKTKNLKLNGEQTFNLNNRFFIIQEIVK